MLPSPPVRILIDYRPALRQRTGVGEYAHQIASALLRRLGAEDELTVFSSSWKDRLGDTGLTGARHVDTRIPVRVLNLTWHRLGWPPIEYLAGPVDIAHSTNPLLMPSRHAAQVVTVYDLFFLDQPQRTSAEIRRDYAALAPSHARRADAVVVISEYTAREVERRLGVDHERIAICRPGAPAWTPRPSSSRPDAGPILFVGTLEPRKNVGALLDAYEQLVARRPNAPALLLAGRETGQSASISERLTRGALAGRTRHLGYVTDDERERLYREASMLVLPSFDEGFGLPVVEAMSIGLPVVAANRGALAEVGAGAAALVDPEDTDALAAAMEALLVDPHRYAAAVESGLRRARQFSWDNAAAELMTAYTAALARRKART